MTACQHVMFAGTSDYEPLLRPGNRAAAPSKSITGGQYINNLSYIFAIDSVAHS